ncbi:MAG: hypothetical protein U5J96_05070 [Ignavibacteriaceae bacterium]|nr:hypothetical protein [Ignavibacteriaceae bacterium]
MKKISVCLGILLIALVGCKSENNNQQEFDTKNFFNEFDKFNRINDKNYIDLEGNWRFSIGDDTAWASPNFEDNNWEKIKVPAMLGRSGISTDTTVLPGTEKHLKSRKI